MRTALILLINTFRLLLSLLAAPFRWLRRKRRPQYLRYRLAGDPPYRDRPTRRRLLFPRKVEPATVTSLDRLGRQLDVLAADPHVKGIVLDVRGVGMSPSKRQDFAALLARFRASGKRVVAYAVQAGNDEYALMCAADQIVLPPAGRVELLGFSAEATAVGAGLRELGVSAEFVRRGDHKTAPELFTHDVVSDVQREMLGRLLDERYEELVERVAEGRKVSPEVARARIDAGPYGATRAVAEGLADAICSEADLLPWLEGTAPATEEKEEDAQERDAWKLGPWPAYAASQVFPPDRFLRLRRLTRLAVVPVDGVIAGGDGGGAPLGPRVSGSEAVARALRAAARDRRAKAILLFINSPGGSATASEMMLESVRRAARRKPVIAYFDRVAASGGYMAALGAKEIWAGPHAIAGSIGVFSGKFDLSGLLGKLGVYREVLTRGSNAGLYSSSRGFTDAERASLEREVEETYQSFLGHVATARGMTKAQVHERAEGRVYSAKGAVEAGLVDRAGSFRDACRRALELAGSVPERFELVVFASAPRRLPFGRLLSQLTGARTYALWWPWLRLPGIDPGQHGELDG